MRKELFLTYKNHKRACGNNLIVLQVNVWIVLVEKKYVYSSFKRAPTFLINQQTERILNASIFTCAFFGQSSFEREKKSYRTANSRLSRDWNNFYEVSPCLGSTKCLTNNNRSNTKVNYIFFLVDEKSQRGIFTFVPDVFWGDPNISFLISHLYSLVGFAIKKDTYWLSIKLKPKKKYINLSDIPEWRLDLK